MAKKRGPKPKHRQQKADGGSKANEGLGKKVEQHPLFEEIAELCRHRFSPETIVRILSWQYRDAIEAGRLPPLPGFRTIHRWREHQMAPAELLPPRLVEQQLERIETKVDVFQSLQQVYTIAENRIARHIALEEKMELPVPGLDRALETLLKVGSQLWQVGQDIGAYPKAGIKISLDGELRGPPATVILQLPNRPPRVLELSTLDLSTLSTAELEALRELNQTVIEGEAVDVTEEGDSR